MRVQGNFLFAIIAEIEAGSFVWASIPLVTATATGVVGNQNIAALRLAIRTRILATPGILPLLAWHLAVFGLQACLGNRIAWQIGMTVKPCAKCAGALVGCRTPDWHATARNDGNL